MKKALSVLALLVVLGAALPASATVPRDQSSSDIATRIVRAFRGLIRALDEVGWPKP
jgi:hypothetical protein